MVQILKQPAFGERLGEALGTGLGGGLSSGLENLAKIRLQNMAQERLRTHLSKGLQGAGYNPEIADQLSYLGEDLLKPVIGQKFKPTTEKLKASAQGIKQLVPELSDSDAENLANTTPGLQLEFYRNYLKAPSDKKIEAVKDLMTQIEPVATGASPESASKQLIEPVVGAEVTPIITKLPAKLQEQQQKANNIIDTTLNKIAPIQTQAEPQAAAISAAQSAEPVKLEPKKPEQIKSLAERVKEGKSIAEAKKEFKEERAFNAKEQAAADKQTKPYFDNLVKANNAAKSNNARLKKLSNLINAGSLPFSAFYKGIQGLSNSKAHTNIPIVGGLADLVINTLAQASGGILRSLQTGITARDTEEFEKASLEAIKDMKDIFGARITNLDLQTFLKLIPTLEQTDRGKKAIIRNMQLMNDATQLKYDAMVKIINENGGRRPNNLEILVDEATKSDMDKIYEEFSKPYKELYTHPSTGQQALV